MRKEVIYLGIRLPPALHAKMAEIAREQSRSMNGQIIMALVDWLKPETWEERKELLGL